MNTCASARRGRDAASEFYVRGTVPDNDTQGPVDAGMPIQPIEHKTWLWFTAATPRRFEMRAYLECFDRFAADSNIGLHISVNRRYICGIHQPFADALLICDHHEMRCPPAQNTDRFNRAGKPLELLPISDIVADDLAIDYSVPIQEQTPLSSRARRHQLADEATRRIPTGQVRRVRIRHVLKWRG